MAQRPRRRQGISNTIGELFATQSPMAYWNSGMMGMRGFYFPPFANFFLSNPKMLNNRRILSAILDSDFKIGTLILYC